MVAYAQVIVVEPETWTRLPGSEWEVWHARKTSVVLSGAHPKGTHGMAVRHMSAAAREES